MIGTVKGWISDINFVNNVSGQSVIFLVLFCVWIIFLTFYMSRVLGPIAALILTYTARRRGWKCVLKLGSLSICLLAGKVMFRHFTFICDDYAIYCNDGYVIFSYWRYIKQAELYARDLKGRLHLTLNGLRIHIYNRLKAYRKLKKDPKFEKLFATLSQHQHHIDEDIMKKNDKFLNNFWAFVGTIRISARNVRVYVGNRLLPTTLVIVSHRTLFTGRLEQLNNDKLLVCSISGSNFSISLNNNEEYDETDPWNLWKRYNAPRTMGSGFKILQNATLKAVYRESVFGDPLSEPICDLNVDFGDNVAIAYGPWAEACRNAFVSYFFPTDFADATPTELPKSGERKIPLQMDITLTMNGKVTINLWFMRHDELNTVAIIIKNGFSIKVENPLVVAQEGYKTVVRFNMKDVQFLPTSGFRKLISYEEFTVECNTFVPKRYGQFQKCEILMKINRATTWCLWDHVAFMQDFVSEASTYYTEDLARFVPQIWNCRIEFTNAKFIFVTNDKNWVDASNPSNNFLIALVAKRLTINCNLNKTDFCPQIYHCKSEAIASEAVAIKFHVPQRSTLSPVIHTLYDNSFGFVKHSTIHISTPSDIDGSWFDFLRTRRITLTYDYKWHPIYPTHQSDLPMRVRAIGTQYPSHPFELEPDSAHIEIQIQAPEMFLSGFSLWIIKNCINDYFGTYSQQQSDLDSYHANASLSKRLYGDVKQDIAKYRPLDMKLSVQFEKAHGSCLTHSVKTTAETPDACPTVKTDVIVVEIVRKIRDLRFQVFIAGFQMAFRKSESFKKVQSGFLSIDQIAIRMNSFSSELHIPWDAGAVDYACAWEVIIGEIAAKIDPTQLVCLAQILEGFWLLAAAVDEELLTPEIYSICQHMNDLRTCPHSNLELVDSENRSQNCESSENLKYMLIRVAIDLMNFIIVEDFVMMRISMEPCRMCMCNCHEYSFCTSFLFGILQLNFKQFIRYSMTDEYDNEWLECGSAHFQDVEFEIRLAFPSKNLYLMNERKEFLKMHDECTKRLYFLWLNEGKCGCYGSFAFFGDDDWSGSIFMADFMQKLARQRINQEPMQPGFGQSIVRSSTKLFDEANLQNIAFSDEYEKSGTKASPNSYSAYPEITKIVSAPGTHRDIYHNFLNLYQIQLSDAKATTIFNRFKLIRKGINDLYLTETRGENQSRENISSKEEGSQPICMQDTQRTSYGRRPIDWGTDPEVVYGWGNISSLTKVFLTPLSVEVIQRLTVRAEMMLTAINPISIIQHAYASCAFRCHNQPIIEKSNAFIQESLLPKVSAHFGVPPLHITLFQGTVTGGKLLRSDKDDGNFARSTTVHCTVTMVYGRECCLNVYSNNQNDIEMICFDAQTLYHAQFAKIVYMRDNTPLTDSWQTNFLTNWQELDISRRLRHSGLTILSELNVPNILLKGFLNRRSFSYLINDSEIVISTGKPRLKISFGCEWDKQRDVTLLHLALTSSLVSWLHVLYQFQKSIHHTLAKYDEWLDFCMCRALSEALDLRDDLILTVCRSSLNEVKRYAVAMDACASCKLMLFLLHHSMHKDESERYNYWKNNHPLELEPFIASKSNRKLILVALLNSWQELLEPYVKPFIDVLTTKEYSRGVLLENMKSLREAFQTASENAVTAEPNRTAGSTASLSVVGSTTTSAIGSNRVNAGVTENPSMKQLKILPVVFFWPIFKNYHLDRNVLLKSPLKRLHFSLKFMVGEFKTYLVQLVKSKSQTIAQQSSLFLLLDTITFDAAIVYNVMTDNEQSKACVSVNLGTLFPRIEVFCTQAVLHLLSELMQSTAYCANNTAILTSLIHFDDTQNSVSKRSESIVIEDDEGKKQKWILTVLNLFREYKMNTHNSEEQNANVGGFSIAVNNNIVISAIKFESKITHLILILRIFNSKTRHNSTHFVDNPRKATHEVTSTIQDVKIVITERGTPDINAIFHCSLTTVTSTFRRMYETNGFQNTVRLSMESMKLNYIIGSSFVIRAEGRNDKDEGNSLSPSSDERELAKQSGQMTHFHFDVEILHGEINAKISSTVAAKYDFKNAHCFGIFPKKGTASIENHFITYTSFYSKKVPKWIRLGSFSIKLPSLLVVYEKRVVNENEIILLGNREIVCSDESYANIVITIGSLDQSINTDVLNMLLYSHETAIAEFAHVMEILRANSSYKSPFLFQLQIYCENVSPWLKLTLTDTTNTAFRITVEVINVFFIGRNILDKDVFERQMEGNMSFCLNFKLGQMIRNEAFQDDELRELADFTTNLMCTLQFSPNSVPETTIILSRTVILFKLSAIIRMKDILRDFTLSRSFWMRQKILHAMQAGSDSSQTTSLSSLLDATYGLSMKITVLFRDRTTLCIPLYSSNYRSFTSALLFGLKDAEAVVKFVRKAEIEAKFSDFKIIFVENFEHSMEESWINGQEITPTNFAFFPLGLCKIVVKSLKSEQYKRAVSVQCSMKGLVFDIDGRIGSLNGAIWNTCEAIKADQDVDATEYEPMKIVISELERDDDINPKNEYASIVKPEKRIRWVEQKIYEQTQKLAVIKAHATDVTYQWELRRLKKLQLIRVKQFKESMLDRLKRQELRGKLFNKAPIIEDTTKDAEEKSDNESATGNESAKLQKIALSAQLKKNIGHTSSVQGEILAKTNDNKTRIDEKMNHGSFAFDMQFFGEAGECVLRNKTSEALTSTKSAAADDVKKHDETSAVFTKILLPSIEAKIYYSTSDISSVTKSFPTKKAATVMTPSNTTTPYLYISANVANMPKETAVTPLVANFFQQLLENLPQRISQQSENESSETFTMTDAKPLLTCIHSKLMINILLSITIQSCSLRFEAHQQRAGSMDLLLRLPSLKLVASSHNDTVNSGGFDISLSLRSFSICFYNPHQPSPLDAFALTLDKFTAGISRTSVFFHDDPHLKITCTVEIGQATFTYDMRKLSQLIAFPAPWYRRRIAQRLLKHNQFLKSQSVESGRSFSKQTSKMMNKLAVEALINVQWEAFKAKIQMSSAMGDTTWIADKISAKFMLCLQPLVERRLNMCLAVSLLEQEAKGGAISGSLRLSNAAFNFNWMSLFNKPTSFSSKINFTEMEMQIVWMGRVVIVVLFDQLSLVLSDEWKSCNDHDGKEQMEDSRTLLNLTNKSLSSTMKSKKKLSQIFHWAAILDLVTDMQMKSKTFPIPNASNGRTIIGGRFISVGQQASVVLMEGEITANRWALFYLNQPTLIFSNAAQYAFIDEKQTIGIDLSEKLLLKLSGVTKENKLHHSTSAICKVERRKNQTLPKYATVQDCLTLCIDEPLAQLFFPNNNNSNKTQPTVLELFELPAMDAIFTSIQKAPIDSDKLRNVKSDVLCSVICNFHHPLGVQTDLTTQINFLPELLRSYLIEQDKEVEKITGKPSTKEAGKDESGKTDQRQYICKKWKVDPKIRFIDKVKWDPPVIDEILRKLQIFDHRNTIPKVLQRHILDHCDMFASKALFSIVKAAKEASVKSDSMTNNV